MLGAPVPAADRPGPDEHQGLRVLTWNLHALGVPWLTTRRCVDATVDVLRRAAPDVVGVQERPLGPLGRYRLRRVARRAGLRVVVGGGGSRTTALLVRDGVTTRDARAVRLPWEPPRTRRGASAARVEGPRGPVRVVVIHLGLDAGERARHLGLLRADLLRVGGPDAAPLVVLGDVNELPDQPSWRTLLAVGLTDAAADAGPTFPTARPEQRIDAVLVGYGLRVTAARVLDDPAARLASDHLPVVVDLVQA